MTQSLAPLGSITERTLPNGKNLYEFKRIYALVSDLYGSVEKSCLDYGCGSGYGSHLLAQHFGSVVGTDIDDDAVQQCARMFSEPNLAFSVFDPKEQPFPDDSFDCVFSFQVLEHVPLDEVPGYIRSIWNMMKPGGLAVITTPNQANYCGGHSGNPYHVKEYSSRQLVDTFRKALPDTDIRLVAQEDVLSTRTGIRIRRALKNRRPAFWLARVVVAPLRVLERAGRISTDHAGMLREERIESVIGGFYIELKK